MTSVYYPEASTSSSQPSPVEYLTPKQSEFNNLHGNKALTPEIAGGITGTVVITGWIIGLIIMIRRRRRHKRRAREIALGVRAPTPEDKEAIAVEPTPKIIIPPDPAVLEGRAQPGEFAFAHDEKRLHHPAFGHFRRSKTMPVVPTVDDSEVDVTGNAVAAAGDGVKSAAASIAGEGHAADRPVPKRSSTGAGPPALALIPSRDWRPPPKPLKEKEQTHT